MKNREDVMTFLEDKLENDLVMIDLVIHGAEKQAERIKWQIGGCDTFIEPSYRYKNKDMVVTPYIPSNREDNIIEIINHIEEFMSRLDNMSGTKSTIFEIWTHTNYGVNDMLTEDITITK